LNPWSWSGDGKTLIGIGTGMSSGDSSTLFQGSIDIKALPMEGDGKVKPMLRENYNENQPQISADGRWLAYTSDESGKNEIYVRPFPNVNEGRWQVSTSGGDKPLWSKDSRELFYQNGDAVMAVSVKTEPAFSPGTPRILFRGTFATGMPRGNSWDISHDGKRFLMMKAAAQTTETEPAAPLFEPPRRINIVVNWIEELKQRVPTK
jgi:eukaryotic-like serine/threonine-protein kinase